MKMHKLFYSTFVICAVVAFGGYTIANAAPAITVDAPSDISRTGATVHWTTDINSTSEVQFGVDTSYGQTATGEASTTARLQKEES